METFPASDPIAVSAPIRMLEEIPTLPSHEGRENMSCRERENIR